MKAPTVIDGHELRGFVVRLYPDERTIATLRILQAERRTVWNWLVSQVEDSLAATRSYAIRSGLVTARPGRPNYDGMSPDESSEARKQHMRACADWWSGLETLQEAR